MKKHINLSSFKGSITDWAELNYVKGGLADEYADIANIKGNYAYYNEEGKLFIKQNYAQYELNKISWNNLDSYGNYLNKDTLLRGKSITNCECSSYPVVERPENVEYGCRLSASLTFIVIHDKSAYEADLTGEQFQTYVKGIFKYPLAMPIDIDTTQEPNSELNRISLILSKSASEQLEEDTPIEAKEDKESK